MNPITNSPIKEAMRQKYHNIAVNRETQIINQVNNECISIQNDATNRINLVTYRNNPPKFICVILAIVIGAFLSTFADPLVGLIIGVILGFGLYIFWLCMIKKANNDLDEYKTNIQNEADSRIQQLRNKASLDIRAAYIDADQKTQTEIDQYDTKVKNNCQNILQKPDAFKAMVDHSVNMFQRMVSHADSASNRKFVETDFIYKVELYGICYKYQSTYSNPKDDFNFDKERYRNLSTREECEGLAQAIAKMTMSKMKSLYPPNSLNITVSHIDAEVTLHFKAANKNYVPPRDIY